MSKRYMCDRQYKEVRAQKAQVRKKEEKRMSLCFPLHCHFSGPVVDFWSFTRGQEWILIVMD